MHRSCSNGCKRVTHIHLSIHAASVVVDVGGQGREREHMGKKGCWTLSRVMAASLIIINFDLIEAKKEELVVVFSLRRRDMFRQSSPLCSPVVRL